MNNLSNTLSSAIDHTLAADLEPIRQFLFTNPSEPLIATGSGGAATAADFAALLYGARGGVATAVSPYTMNSYSDEALRTAKLLLVSKGGHNSDIVFATRRALSVNPEKTAAINFIRHINIFLLDTYQDLSAGCGSEQVQRASQAAI